MTHAQFISLLRGETAAPEGMEKLQAFLQDHPYCQTVRLMAAQAMGASAIPSTEKKLAAVYACDRRRLQQLLEGGRQTREILQEERTLSPALEMAGEASPAGENIFRDDPQPTLLSATQGENIFRPETAGSIFNTSAEPAPDTAPPVPVPEVQKFQPATDDPHEVIRRRLEEIFSARTSPAAEVPPPEESTQRVEMTRPPEVHGPPVMEQPSPPQVSETSAFQEDREPSLPLETTASDVEEVLIRKEFMQLKDEVDREELVHAAEETVLQNLEVMPVQEGKESFTGWLKRKAVAPYGTLEEVRSRPSAVTTFSPDLERSLPEQSSQEQLIERFIATEPRIVPSKTEFYSPAMQAKRSVEEDDELVSETLAAIYMEQGLLAKARLAYEKLSLLYPEKSSSFAALIQKIDTLNSEE